MNISVLVGLKNNLEYTKHNIHKLLNYLNKQKNYQQQ